MSLQDTKPEPPSHSAKVGVHDLKVGVHGFYEKHEKYFAIATFFAGFLWDSLTLTRIDNPLDNLILLGYLLLIGVMIVFTLRRQCGVAPPRFLLRLEPIFPWAMQFCFGGLFSSYVVFYFKSASFTRTQVFLLVLVILMVANEFLQHRLQNPKLLAVLYTFCLLSFLAFFLPIILSAINEWVFLLGGLISLMGSLTVFILGFRPSPEGCKARLKPVVGWIPAVIVAVNILYFANFIPPVPLALKDVGIYHKVSRTAAGYQVTYVPPSTWRFWVDWESPFHLSPGDRVYCYTAIFAPGKVRVRVCHVWSRKTPTGWVQTDRLPFEIAAGREQGYRGYTFKRGVQPGKWRVSVETMRGQTLGDITFDVVPAPAPPPMKTVLKR